jgi:uncharacterized protein (TIGR03089 family)
MSSPLTLTVVSALAARDSAQPLVTFYDDATGERTELSGATMSNWVAKTANLLVDGVALEPGEVAAVRLPTHWQTAAVLLGCWTAGLSVDLNGSGAAAPALSRAAVAFVTADAVGRIDADEIFALALAPLAAPFRSGPPPGARDFVVDVRGHADHFVPVTPVGPGSVALADGTHHSELVAAAAARGIPGGARLLIDADTVRDPVTWLVAPLVAESSVVLCRNLDPARLMGRLATERATTWPP